MRTREEIQKDVPKSTDVPIAYAKLNDMQQLQIEALLDIRDLLFQNEHVMEQVEQYVANQNQS